MATLCENRVFVHIKVDFFCSVQPWGSSTIIYSLVVQLLVALVALLDIHWSRVGLVSGRGTCWRSFSSYVVDLGLDF